MRRDAIVYLEDIRIAASDIVRFTDGMGENYLLSENLVIRLAVERQLITAGEAITQLARSFPDIAAEVPDWRQIISFRNILVHGYRAIDHAIVLAVILERIPILLQTVEAMLVEQKGRR